MQRRSLLAAAGSSLAVALPGCSGDDGDTASADAVDGVDVRQIDVRDGLRFQYSPGADAPYRADGVIARNGRQWILATVEADRELDRSQFAVETDEWSWSPGFPEPFGDGYESVGGRSGGPVGPEPTFLAVDVPSPLDGTDPRIRFEGQETGAWPLPEDAREALAAPAPRFQLEGLLVPETVTQGESMSVTLTVTNAGDGDGRLHAAVYLARPGADEDESIAHTRRIGAGQTIATSLSLDTSSTRTSTGPATVAVDGHVAAARDVTVEVPDDG